MSVFAKKLLAAAAVLRTLIGFYVFLWEKNLPRGVAAMAGPRARPRQPHARERRRGRQKAEPPESVLGLLPRQEGTDTAVGGGHPGMPFWRRSFERARDEVGRA